MTGLPTVPVYDLKIHPRDRELIAGTHGRAMWIVDIAPLELMNNGVMANSAYFFAPKTAYQYSVANGQAFYGNQFFRAPNPPYGAELVYRLTSGTPRDSAHIVVTNVKGDTIRLITGAGGPGVHRATWDLRGMPRPLGPAARRDSIAAANRRRAVLDSIRRTGGDTTTGGLPPGADTAAFRAARDSIAAMMARGDTAGARAFREQMRARAGAGGGARGGRRGGAPAEGEYPMRPAEAATLGPATPGEGFGGGGGGGFGGGRAGPAVEPGDYLVTINVGGTQMRQVVHVERVSEIVNSEFGFGDDDDSHEP
jgi:hypothetical protein